MRPIAAFIAMLSLALPAAATASESQFPVGGDAMNGAMATAQQHWGGVPCGGAVELRWSDMDPSMHARATWSSTPGAPPAEYTGCMVEFNRQVLYDPGRLCTAMLHEVGHLMGQAHSEDPGSPMSHEYLGPVGPCDLGTVPASAGDAASTRPAARRCRTLYRKARSGRRIKRRVCARTRTTRH